MLMANAVMGAAAETPGKESKAMEAYAEALRQLPAIIAENGGYDAAELITQLRAAHTQGKATYGLGKLIVSEQQTFFVIFKGPIGGKFSFNKNPINFAPKYRFLK